LAARLTGLLTRVRLIEDATLIASVGIAQAITTTLGQETHHELGQSVRRPMG
jgi:hypothetical protein